MTQLYSLLGKNRDELKYIAKIGDGPSIFKLKTYEEKSPQPIETIQVQPKRRKRTTVLKYGGEKGKLL